MSLSAVHHVVRHWAEVTPDAPAVSDARGPVTYAGLQRAVEHLADRLAQSGVGPQDVVAVELERSVELLVAMLASFRRNAATVLLDPGWPGPLIEGHLRRMQPVARLVGPDAGTDVSAAGAVSSRAGRAVLVVDRDERRPDPALVHRPAEPVALDDVAWVVFTSGSTGRSKAVEVTHRALAHRASTHQVAYGLGARSRASWLTPPGSSISSVEIWPVLAAGGCLRVGGPDVGADPVQLRDWLVGERVSTAFLTMPVGAAVVAEPWPDAELRLVTLGGDSVHRWPDPALPFEVAVEYGCAEASAVTSCLVPPDRLTSWTVPEADRPTRPAVGRPWPEVEVWLLDQRMRPVPDGSPGELFVGGPELSRGYRGDPGATARAFVPHPWSSGQRLYRTGDLARRDAAGRVHHLGRIDHQVKIRGHRVEPAEVEAALLRHPGVVAAVVTGRADPRGQSRLVAYVVPAGSMPEAAALRAVVAERLPAPMVPTAILELPRLPLNAAGKVDRGRLPDPDWSVLPGGAAATEPSDEPGPDPNGSVPAGDLERVVRRAWTEILGAAPTAGSIDFVSAGGDSLLASRLLASVARGIGTRVRMRDFFTEPTPDGLVRLALAASRDAAGG